MTSLLWLEGSELGFNLERPFVGLHESKVKQTLLNRGVGASGQSFDSFSKLCFGSVVAHRAPLDPAIRVDFANALSKREQTQRLVPLEYRVQESLCEKRSC